MIPRRGVKIKFFLSVVIPVVKAVFVPLSATGEKPSIARVARLCGVSPHPIPDTTTALPNLLRTLFSLVYSGFQPFPICFTYSLALLSPLFPSVPEPYVVIYVVKNASRPVSGELSPVPDGKRFSFLCGLYCNSEQTVMQVVSAKAAAQMLSRYRQRIGRKDRQRYFSYSLSINPLIQA